LKIDLGQSKTIQKKKYQELDKSFLRFGVLKR